MSVRGTASSSSAEVRPQKILPKTQSKWAGYVPAFAYSSLEVLGGMTQLGLRVLVSAITRPVGYWRVVRDDMYFVLKASWFPIIAAIFTFGAMVSIHCFNFNKLTGTTSRCGQYFFVVNIRDFSPWINSLVVAGVIGAAICSDLGSRKVREELDAMEVLGVDPIRELVLPRVVSITLLTPMLLITSVMIILLNIVIGATAMAGVPVPVVMELVFSNLTIPELVGALLKATITGYVIGVVCAYKGINAAGGSIGVGRAVNQSVVISFVGVFIISGTFNMILTGLNPIMQQTR